MGDDLYVTVPLNLYTAILGGEQIVETMDSKAKLKVKPGTQNNTKVRLRGKGFPVYKEEGKFGDMIVTYSIDIPTNLTDKQKNCSAKYKVLIKNEIVMQTDLIIVSEYCRICHIEPSFLYLLQKAA